MTIARDRWQHHLKTAGDYYRSAAQAAAVLGPAVGGDVAALALGGLATLLETCRVHRLTRNQHVLLRLGELISYAECAASLARRANAVANGTRNEKADKRFDAPALATISRVFAREAAQKVVEDGVRWVAGSLPSGHAGIAELADGMRLDDVRAAQAGLLADLDHLADVLYARVS